MPGTVLLLLALAAPSFVHASELPWVRAEMVARKLFLTARTTLSLEPGPDEETASLRVESSFLGRRTESLVVVDRRSGATRERSKIQHGRDPYQKTYRFETGVVHETRRAPATPEERDLPPERWTEVRKTEHPIPEGCHDPIHPEALFWLLAREAPAPGGGVVESCAFTGDGFVRLSLQALGITVEAREFELGDEADGVSDRVSDRVSDPQIEVLQLQLDGRALDNDAAEEMDFLGLEGTIGLSVDRATGAPIRVRGEIPPAGTVVVRLERLVP